MAIYTRFGDSGTTALLDGRSVSKDDLRIEACGSVDELNSVLGVVISFNESEELRTSLIAIQHDLFAIGAELASKRQKIKRLNPNRVRELETEIDMLEKQLPALNHFILPGGSKTASLLHHARTVCRRAERVVVALSKKEKINTDITTYLNRAGDLLFIHARAVNYSKKIKEIIWIE